jgi:hypothetical protein
MSFDCLQSEPLELADQVAFACIYLPDSKVLLIPSFYLDCYIVRSVFMLLEDLINVFVWKLGHYAV